MNNDEEIKRALNLYNQLYLEKYSQLNPQFSLNFFQLIKQKTTGESQSILTAYVLANNNRIDGVIAFFVRDNVMTCPIFGYDTTVSQEEGLSLSHIDIPGSVVKIVDGRPFVLIGSSVPETSSPLRGLSAGAIAGIVVGVVVVVVGGVAAILWARTRSSAQTL